MLVPEAIFYLVRGVKIKSEKPGGGYTGFLLLTWYVYWGRVEPRTGRSYIREQRSRSQGAGSKKEAKEIKEPLSNNSSWGYCAPA